MEKRETEIRAKAEALVSQTLPRHKRVFFNWILFHARRGVRHRENLRFSRTKLFGIFRSLFRAIGSNLVALGLLKHRQDVFYLTVEEIFAFVDGRSVTNDISGLVELRRKEYDGYRKVGMVGVWRKGGRRWEEGEVGEEAKWKRRRKRRRGEWKARWKSGRGGGRGGQVEGEEGEEGEVGEEGKWRGRRGKGKGKYE